MGAYNNMDEKIAGLKLGVSESSRVASFRVAESAGIAFGVPIFGYDDDALNAYEAHTDVNTILWDADFVSLNSIVVTINGVAGTAVVFDTDQATTMAALVTQLEADFTGLDAERTDIAGDDRTLKLFLKGQDIVASAVVTLGASQAGDTVTASNQQVFLGVSLFTQLAHVDNVGLYEFEDAMNVLETGWIYVNAHEAVEANTDAPVVTAIGATQGQFGTSGFDTGCRYRESVSAAGLVLIEVRGQKG